MLDADLDRPTARPTSRSSRSRSSSSPRSTTAPSRPSCSSCSTRSPRCPTRSRVRRDGDDAPPAVVRDRPASAPTSRSRFAGIPMGHEFTSLVLALLQVGGHPPKVDAERDRADPRRSTATSTFETYFSLTCQNCPDVVQALNLMSVLNPRITPRRHRRRAVPGRGRRAPGHGRADRVPQRRAVRPGPHERSSRSSPSSTPAPPSARPTKHRRQGALRRARRRRRPGRRGRGDLRRPQGHPHRRRRRALRRPGARHAWPSRTSSRCRTPRARSSPPRSSSTSSEYDVDIMNLQRARRAGARRRAGRPASTVELESGAIAAVAHGRARRPAPAGGTMNVPGEDEYRNKGVAYCPHCDGPLFKGKRVAVIGGGNSGVEAAIDLAGIVAHVTLIEFDDAAARRRGAAAQAAQPAQRRRHRSARRPPRCIGDGEQGHRPGLQGPRDAARSHARRARRRLRADRPAAQHRVARRAPSSCRRAARSSIDDRGPDLGARRVRRRRLHHGAVQADRHRHGRRRDGRAERLRPPDPHLGPADEAGVDRAAVASGRRPAPDAVGAPTSAARPIAPAEATMNLRDLRVPRRRGRPPPLRPGRRGLLRQPADAVDPDQEARDGARASSSSSATPRHVMLTDAGRAGRRAGPGRSSARPTTSATSPAGPRTPRRAACASACSRRSRRTCCRTWCPTLHARFPNLELLLVEEKTEVVLQRLRDGRLDVGVLALPIARRPAPRGAAVRRGLRARRARRPSAGRARRAGRRCRCSPTSTCCCSRRATACATRRSPCASSPAPTERSGFRATSLETLRQMVAAGVGVTLLPELAVQPPVRAVGRHRAAAGSPIRCPAAQIAMFWRPTSVYRRLPWRKLAEVVRDLPSGG